MVGASAELSLKRAMKIKALLPRRLVCALVILGAGAPAHGVAATEEGGTGETLPTRVHDEPTFLFEDGCAYAAIVSGWLFPGLADPKGAIRVRARVAVSASVSCPKSPIARSIETLDSNASRTMDEVAGWIERIGTVRYVRSNRPCVYAPELSLDQGGLRIELVARMCRSATGKRVDGKPA
jgi:hypothetical protein